MDKIKVLPINLVNKIAAGEVIERPAAVLKELIENSIDAEAMNISISLEEGGKKVIKVEDDGKGISFDDLSLAFASHATSKLESTEDLFNIRTLGFRGEALASIGSVAHVTITSKNKDAELGGVISCNGGQINPSEVSNCSVGTVVEVKNLFFNTPARRKFIGNDRLELSNCVKMLTRFALSHPNIRLEMENNKKNIFKLPKANSLPERISHFFGNDIINNLIEINEEKKDINIRGFVGDPSIARSSTKMQFFFINNRFVKDKILYRALMNAYDGYLMTRQYPACFLFLTINPTLIDVNVHPTKIEVRFKNSKQVFNLIKTSIAGKLSNTKFKRDVSLPMNVGFSPRPTSELHKNNVENAIKDFFSSNSTRTPTSSFPHRQPYMQFNNLNTYHHDAPQLPPYIQIHNSYIVLENDDGILLIDQHALHEKVILNKLKKAYEGKQLNKQRLLVPQIVEIEKSEIELVDDIKGLLNSVGFEINRFGPNSISINTVPTILGTHKNILLIVREILDRIIAKINFDENKKNIDKLNNNEIIHDIIAGVACKAAVKAGDALKQDEIKELINIALTEEQVSSCAHGRPTMIKITMNELEKYFRRK